MENYEHCESNINGVELARFATPSSEMTAPGYVVLYYVAGRTMPYVTWRQNVQNGACEHGSYFPTLAEAQKSFLERCSELVVSHE